MVAETGMWNVGRSATSRLFRHIFYGVEKPSGFSTSRPRCRGAHWAPFCPLKFAVEN